MRNFCLQIAYDGSLYGGWQKNRDLPTIELFLQKVLEQILQQPINLQAASRTDAGVHATGQVVNFFTQNTDISPERLLISCNALLPKDIRVLSAKEACGSFHPTLDNKGKEYHYHICYGPVQNPLHRHYSWHFPYLLDIQLMSEQSQVFLGKHDFSFFKNQGSNGSKDDSFCTLKSIAVVTQGEKRVRIEMQGDRFLYKMARNIAGTLAYIGCGKLQSNAAQNLISGAMRPEAGITAPACGLQLIKVFY